MATSSNKLIGRGGTAAVYRGLKKASILRVIKPVSEIITELPSTRYYGSKRRLLPWIFDNIRGLRFDSALDALGGTASVSLVLKAMQKRVTYHDGFRFNQDVATTLLSDKVAMDRADVLDFVSQVGNDPGIVAAAFRGIYYTDDENAWIDGFLGRLKRSNLTKEQSSLLRYLLYQACLKKRPFNLFHRSNLHLRTNRGIKRSFGNHVTWERSFQHHIMQAYDELPERFPVQNRCTVLASGNVDRLKVGYDLVYIDPPYISSISRYNRDDYWRRYHFLEGLANYDTWEGRMDMSSDIRLLKRPKWMADWASRENFQARLFSLVKRHCKSQVVLSYVTDAYPSEIEIRRFFEMTFSNVSVHSRQHSHALGATPRRELLFVGRP